MFHRKKKTISKEDFKKMLETDVNSPAKERSSDEVPHVKGKALGYRSWIVQDYSPNFKPDFLCHTDKDVESKLKFSLMPMFKQGYDWIPGENKAICFMCKDSLPGDNCECGLYAYNRLSEALNYRRSSRFLHYFSKGKDASLGIITGAVAGYGKLQIHATGWRSEKSEIIAFLYTGIFNSRFSNKKKYNQAKELAKEYGVPLFRSKRKFKKYAKTKAMPISKNIIAREGVFVAVANFLERNTFRWIMIMWFALMARWAFMIADFETLAYYSRFVWLGAIVISLIASVIILLRKK